MLLSIATDVARNACENARLSLDDRKIGEQLMDEAYDIHAERGRY